MVHASTGAREPRGAAVFLSLSSLPFQGCSVEASFYGPLSSETSVDPCLSRAISPNPLLSPPYPMPPHQMSLPHLLTVTPVFHLFLALFATSLAGLLPVWGSPPLPGSLTSYELPSPGWASASTPFPH